MSNTNPATVPVTELSRLGASQLRKLWRELGSRGDPPSVKALAVRDLAWHIQSQQTHDLDAQTHSLLRAAIGQAETDAKINVVASAKKSGKKTTRPKKRRASRKLELVEGTRLVRTWRGVDHEVLVTSLTPAPGSIKANHRNPEKTSGGRGGGGKVYVYRGQSYRSLTQIAQEITGAHWSGPRFFGINRLHSIH